MCIITSCLHFHGVRVQLVGAVRSAFRFSSNIKIAISRFQRHYQVPGMNIMHHENGDELYINYRLRFVLITTQ